MIDTRVVPACTSPRGESRTTSQLRPAHSRLRNGPAFAALMRRSRRLDGDPAAALAATNAAAAHSCTLWGTSLARLHVRFYLTLRVSCLLLTIS
jgi:hypothetical protein